ncbi:MAG TPA: isopeptide-forming domain-containing fimbrial protein, partial [Nocardioidaceae bacterium]|nr:isopeptide-forming domain-containing fimbrial protein [Nocardioidaceae bacterium]
MNVKIQGFDKISRSWTAGNTAGYAELEKIPFRIPIANGSTGVTVDSVETIYDHERTGVNGIETLQDFVLCKGSLTSTWTPTAPGANGLCTTVLVYPAGTVPDGAEPYVTDDGFRAGSGGTTVGVFTWHRLAIPAGATWTLTWGAKLALGSHLYNGSALHMQIGAASVNGAAVTFGSKDVPIPVNAIIATETDKKINGSDGPVPVSLGDRVRITIVAKAFGPAKASQTLVVTDTLPACLTFDGDDATVAGTPTVSGKNVTYTFSNVKNGTSVLAAFFAR